MKSWARLLELLFSVDEKDASFLCRLKVVATNPAIKCHRMFGGVLRDCSHDTGTVNKLLNLIDGICTKRSGRRDGPGITGLDDDVLDIDPKKTICKKIFCCASDGAEVMVQALQKM